MKKLTISIIVIVLLAFSLASCGDSKETQTETTVQTTTQADPDAEMKSEAENAVINKLMSEWNIPASKIDPQYSKTEKSGNSYKVYIRTPMVDGTTTETVYTATPVDDSGHWTVDDGEYIGEVTD